MSEVKLTEFQKKRLEYFKKAAQTYDWIRLAPGDIDILDHAEANEHNYKAADSWEEAALKQQEYGNEKEVEVIELRELIEVLQNKLKQYET